MAELHILVALTLDAAQRGRLLAAAPGFALRFTTPAEATEADVLWANGILGNLPVALIQKNRRLVWFQSNWAGPDEYLAPGVLPESCVITNVTGAYGLAISEWMLGMWLALAKDLCLYRDNQRTGTWAPISRPVRGIFGARALCVGLGDIGCSFARRAAALGAEVVGVRRRAAACPPYCRRVILPDELDAALPEADLVALSMPGTPETHRLFDAARIARMKPGSILINVGRGSAVDPDALCAALQSGQLFGAALDVTDPEPLPPEHPLWAQPNVLITPHIAGKFSLPATLDRIVDIFAHNLARFAAGQPLDNQVNRLTHYVSGGGRLNSAEGSF